jgi:hypothetical protein
MSLPVAVLILAGVDAVTVTAMLLLRRRAPSGSFFQDSQQASGVFSVVGTTFAVLVAFTFLMAFQSFDRARSSSQDEATSTTALFHAAELFPPTSRDALRGDLVCYARAVIRQEWPAMRRNQQSRTVRKWTRALERDFEATAVRGVKAEAAFNSWFDQNQQRAKGRRARLDEASPLVPPIVWLFLVVGGLVVIGYVGYFADPRERRLSQAGMIFAVTTMVAAGLLMVRFLDHAYDNQAGSVTPQAMSESLASMETEDAALTPGVHPRCDRRGAPTAPIGA